MGYAKMKAWVQIVSASLEFSPRLCLVSASSGPPCRIAVVRWGQQSGQSPRHERAAFRAETRSGFKEGPQREMAP